ncbi:efflux RND transporter periplasmic adaptor subunit [Acidovorax sp. A1169]|uniref:efflux RND transporter periplasmic adaptor subunit n=1 Tax=Acidovorax sp. A1169 TaxID=3059524 RepID=UPI002737965A|nr:HlyD family efflux transporter periplasmic adaptor subunit [Acidovorax sp. A1169]MDP4076755.1 HlyD family efflux transporter periplasmic adaptor subunit [Acidovorax sp. A1169]
MKPKTWIYSASALLALAVAAAWAFAPRPIEVELAPAMVGRFEMSVEEDGKTRLAERYVVSSPLAGRLSRIELHEGDAVAEGATVALLTPALPSLLDERGRRELRARLEGAEAAVEGATARQGRARVVLEQARNEAWRSEQLAQQGFIAATRLESDRLAARAAVKELEAATAQLHVASHDVEQARAALGTGLQPPGLTAGRGFAVRSPIAGQVLRVLQANESTVALGTPLLELGDTSRLEIVAELLTADALAVRQGSSVVVERWGGPQVLQGHVTRVEPSAFTKVSALGVEEQRVRVVIGLSSPREQWLALGDGFRVGVRVITQVQEQVLQVPVSAVFPLAAVDAEAKAPVYAVFAMEEGRARTVRVSLAGRNGSTAWLRDGLSPGAHVIVYPPSAVRDGARVRERKV